MQAHDAVLRIEDLRKGFVSPHGRIEVLRGIDLVLPKGVFAAIVGESGAGKTTFLQTIGGLEPMDAGKVWICGEPVHDQDSDALASLRLKHLGFVYQFHHLVPELSALENAMLPLLLRGMPEARARAQASELLARLGLEKRLEHPPAQLSGGEAQRVAIARALIGKPDLVLADEPTGNLDERTGLAVFSLFRETAQATGSAVVVVTHSLRLARLCDRVWTLTEGRLHAGIHLD